MILNKEDLDSICAMLKDVEVFESEKDTWLKLMAYDADFISGKLTLEPTKNRVGITDWMMSSAEYLFPDDGNDDDEFDFPDEGGSYYE